jgi:glucoamylase
MVQSTTALLAAGNIELPLRALIYLAVSQQPDGGFPQNFWINGTPHQTGIQLDEVAAPILLAWRLREENALRDVDPYPLVLRAARYLIEHGPATGQERWEEAGGYAPSTLAATIAALICSAAFARERKDTATAQFLEEYADFLEGHVEAWTVTTDGTLVPEIKRHYIRINPVDVHDPQRNEDPNQGALDIANQPPGARRTFPAKEIVDAGFLQLVRFGIRTPDDPLIVDSPQVVDAVLMASQQSHPPFHPVCAPEAHATLCCAAEAVTTNGGAVDASTINKGRGTIHVSRPSCFERLPVCDGTVSSRLLVLLRGGLVQWAHQTVPDAGLPEQLVDAGQAV